MIFHILALLLPSGISLSEQTENVQLMEFQFLNEDEPEEVPVETPKPPEEVTPPTPVKPPEEVVETPEEVVDEIMDDVIADEVIEPPKVVKPVKPEPQTLQSTKIISSASPTQSNQISAPVKSSQLDNSNFKPFGNKKPHYPSFAKKSGIEGWVKIKVLVNKKGKVINAKVIDYMGHPSFKNATIAVARGWRFPIPIAKGKRVETWYLKKVAFQLRG